MLRWSAGPDASGGGIVHASAVAFDNPNGWRAVLICGPSGSGKSALALQLMSLGARLVADDQTVITRAADYIALSAPSAISGMIEARGVGILQASPVSAARLWVVVDLSVVENARLPVPKYTHFSTVQVPILHKVESSHFPAAISQYIQI
jgi:HPr kinase/phosphorylase